MVLKINKNLNQVDRFMADLQTSNNSSSSLIDTLIGALFPKKGTTHLNKAEEQVLAEVIKEDPKSGKKLKSKGESVVTGTAYGKKLSKSEEKALQSLEEKVTTSLEDYLKTLDPDSPRAAALRELLAADPASEKGLISRLRSLVSEFSDYTSQLGNQILEKLAKEGNPQAKKLLEVDPETGETRYAQFAKNQTGVDFGRVGAALEKKYLGDAAGGSEGPGAGSEYGQSNLNSMTNTWVVSIASSIQNALGPELLQLAMSVLETAAAAFMQVMIASGSMAETAANCAYNAGMANAQSMTDQAIGMLVGAGLTLGVTGYAGYKLYSDTSEMNQMANSARECADSLHEFDAADPAALPGGAGDVEEEVPARAVTREGEEEGEVAATRATDRAEGTDGPDADERAQAKQKAERFKREVEEGYERKLREASDKKGKTWQERLESEKNDFRKSQMERKLKREVYHQVYDREFGAEGPTPLEAREIFNQLGGPDGFGPGESERADFLNSLNKDAKQDFSAKLKAQMEDESDEDFAKHKKSVRDALGKAKEYYNNESMRALSTFFQKLQIFQTVVQALGSNGITGASSNLAAANEKRIEATNQAKQTVFQADQSLTAQGASQQSAEMQNAIKGLHDYYQAMRENHQSITSALGNMRG